MKAMRVYMLNVHWLVGNNKYKINSTKVFPSPSDSTNALM
jgi:hypothetical protein